MDREKVVSLREKLKAGKNLPVSININNNDLLIDESYPGQFVLWDDDNEIVYSIHIPAFQMDSNAVNNKVTVFGISYELIEGMQISLLPISLLPDVLKSICTSDAVATADHQKAIVDAFEKFLLNPDCTVHTRDNLNKYTGSSVPTGDDYYNGRYVNNFKETIATERFNKAADEVIKKYPNG